MTNDLVQSTAKSKANQLSDHFAMALKPRITVQSHHGMVDFVLSTNKEALECSPWGQSIGGIF